MSWRALTESDLKTAISPDELALLRAALGGDAEDSIGSTLVSLSNELRGYIAAGGSDLDATAATLPESVIAQAAIIGAFRVATRAGGSLADPKGMRKAEYDGAVSFFREIVAAGKFGIEAPATTTTETINSSANTPAYTAKTLTLQRDDQSGL